jgi:hypothetical protein
MHTGTVSLSQRIPEPRTITNNKESAGSRAHFSIRPDQSQTTPYRQVPPPHTHARSQPMAPTRLINLAPRCGAVQAAPSITPKALGARRADAEGEQQRREATYSASIVSRGSKPPVAPISSMFRPAGAGDEQDRYRAPPHLSRQPTAARAERAPHHTTSSQAGLNADRMRDGMAPGRGGLVCLSGRPPAAPAPGPRDGEMSAADSDGAPSGPFVASLSWTDGLAIDRPDRYSDGRI